MLSEIAKNTGLSEGSTMMSLSPRSRALHADWFDWCSSATRDFVVLFGGVVLASILVHVYE
ncbi:hypothetical protein E4K64_39310 [Bradyrhizobium frederickii]|uniref:Uncharacterized protein n=1 Tax=Bradyrhizobium frederickii TaxID=2560054 RepID=A0A4Y9KQK7_9BRAD|nr:hypothetical protein E4K66_39785 [Bradyrhizobium frederickii]TFV66649.1 hypothetical protein E4K64_39310 [Bradyrhizobium frederickii]